MWIVLRLEHGHWWILEHVKKIQRKPYLFNPIDANSISITMLAKWYNSLSLVTFPVFPLLPLLALFFATHIQRLLLGCDLALFDLCFRFTIFGRLKMVFDGTTSRFLLFAFWFATITKNQSITYFSKFTAMHAVYYATLHFRKISELYTFSYKL